MNPVLDLTGAAINGEPDERNPSIHLPNQATDSPLLAFDIGGTLIKLVYFEGPKEHRESGNTKFGGTLRFKKFQRNQLDECFEFIQSKNLLPCNGTTAPQSNETIITIKGTGSGIYNFAKIIENKLNIRIDHLNELESNASGSNFLLQKIKGGSFTHLNGKQISIDYTDPENLFPYILVNIGSGISMLEVKGYRKSGRLSGTQISGSTMFGLAKLLTGCTSYDMFLEMSQKGNNLELDLIAKDINGEVSVPNVASSFGKVINSERSLSDYKKEDIAASLSSAFTYNIAQVSYLVAALMGIKRLVFGGSFIHGQTSTMDNIASSIDSWSRGEMQAVFLRHEGFLGALGALTSYEPAKMAFQRGLREIGYSNVSKHFDEKLSFGYNNDKNDIFPYLFVNIGSGISMIKVNTEGKFERIIGSAFGGDTILGLGKLLTGCSSYEELLELSKKGNHLSVDLTAGDNYGQEGFPNIGLPATIIVGVFGKINSNKLSEYKPEDLAVALLNLFALNVGQIVYLVASLHGLKRIFFRGVHEKIMNKISSTLKYMTKGLDETTFLCHEGFLGTLGEFQNHEKINIDEVIREVVVASLYNGDLFPFIPPTPVE